jgi:membrane-associated phospholipid phosphatase
MSKLCFFSYLAVPVLMAQSAAQVEPRAGSWKTWVISSGRDFRVAPPPDAQGTREEIAWIKSFMAEHGNNPDVARQIQHWDSGPPVYRWSDLIVTRFLNGQSVGTFQSRTAYVSMAMYDATIAAWEAKYFYNRPRPSATDVSVVPGVSVPQSPSYPSDYAAAAGAAAEVLAYLIPAEANQFRIMAEEAGRSRLLAGVEYPSDYQAGLELGRKVAAEVIAKARQDGSDAVWDGRMPAGPCMWTGANPGNVTAPQWKPLLLSSPAEFRPPPPPDCQSADVQAQLDEVRSFTRDLAAPLNSPTFTQNWKGFFWQSPAGQYFWAHIHLNRWLLEDRTNPPRAARALAAMDVTAYDSFIASQDGKFAYWYLRPAQLDRRLLPLFPAPNFPSYPSNHSTFSSARAAILSHLFPERAAFITSLAEEAGQSRIWAGIHYQMDNASGMELGRKVAQKIVDWVSKDGSQ